VGVFFGLGLLNPAWAAGATDLAKRTLTGTSL
ncbi:uncharacterized protein METZ01_LOCUS6779, partial [marine metagenome]